MAEEGEVVQSGEGETIMNSLKEVLKKSLIHDGLARGLYQSVKALDKRQAHLCVLSSSCTEPAYTRLVKALCAEHNIHLITVKDSKTLGEWVGLCKLDKEAKPRKIVGCTCCVVKDFGEESESLNVLMDYLKKRGQ